MPRARRRTVKVIVTGPTGTEKRAFLEDVVHICKHQYQQEVQLCRIEDLLREEDPRVTPTSIAENPGEFEKTLRLVFQKILKVVTKSHTIIDMHATYRYKNSLFPVKDPKLIDYLKEISPDFYITLIDNLDMVYFRLSERSKGKDQRARLTREFLDNPLTLKDILVWREEEIIATQALANLTYQAVPEYSPWRRPQNYVVPREHGPQLIAQLLFNSRDVKGRAGIPKIYASFPATGISRQEQKEVAQFKRFLKERGIIFDPLTITEYRLVLALKDAQAKGKKPEDLVPIKVPRGIIQLRVGDLVDIAPEIAGQIISRDYIMIDQSDAVIAYVGQDPSTKGPKFHFGVDGELNYAISRGKETIVISRVPESKFTPWIKNTTPRAPLSFSQAEKWLLNNELGVLRT